MAKHKRTDFTAEDAEDRGASALSTVALVPEPPVELIAEVSIPISEELPSEFPIHLDVTLPPPSATTLRRIAMALDRQQARTSDGQRVVKPTQALRWLLEQATIRPLNSRG